MAVRYLDTSALVKRYVAEPGSTWMRRLTRPSTGHELLTVRLTGPEMISALMRKVSTGQASLAEVMRAITRFRRDWHDRLQVLGIPESLAELSMDLAQQHRLRGCDAVHL